MGSTPIRLSSRSWSWLGLAFVFTVMAAASLPQVLPGAQPGQPGSPPSFSPVAWGLLVASAVACWAMFIVISVRQPFGPVVELDRPD